MTIGTETQERISADIVAKIRTELERQKQEIVATINHIHNANVSAAGAYAATLKNEGKAKKSGPFE
jgi:hypothetical protein